MSDDFRQIPISQFSDLEYCSLKKFNIFEAIRSQI